MKKIKIKDTKKRVKRVKEILERAGTNIGSVWFIRRGDGGFRKMTYRLHVKSPTYAPTPKTKQYKELRKKNRRNDQMIVLDCNKVNRNRLKRMNGRGARRTIPLEGVKRIKVSGEVYHFYF